MSKQKPTVLLPSTLYVREEVDGDDRYYIATENVDDIPEDEDGEFVGIYVFQEMRTLVVKKELT